MRFVSLTRNGPLDGGIGNRLGISIRGWILIGVLSSLLVATGVIGYFGWTISNADVPMSGYVAMGLGVIFSLAVGVGLMGLVFYSSRRGFDEPAILIRDLDEANEIDTRPQEKR